MRRKKREAAELAALVAAQEWQRRMWEWQQMHPGVPVMEARVTRTDTTVVWHGPRPSRETKTE